MEEKMIYGLTTPFTHTTPINHDQTSLPKIIQHENPSKGSRPHKEINFKPDFNLSNTHPRERIAPHPVPLRRKRKHNEERTHLKQLPL
jgi:hypothetical protein